MRANQIWGLMALLVLSTTTACNGGDSDSGHETDTDTGETDTNVPGEVGEIQVNTTFDGGDVSCFVNLDGTKKGTTNTVIGDIPTGTYELTLGDGDRLSPDGLPIHDLGANDMVIAPAETFVVHQGSNAPLDRTFNRYIEGRWTCSTSSDPGNPWTGEVTYLEGDTLSAGVFHDVTVNGEELSFDDGSVTKTGSFTSPTTLHMTSTGGMAGNYEIDCHKGD